MSGSSGGPVQHLRRESGVLPVLRPARHDEPHSRLPQPPHGPARPVGHPAGQRRRHLLRAVEEEQQGTAEVSGEVGEPLGCVVAQAGRVERGARVGHDRCGPGQRPAGGVRDRHVVVPQVGAAQPQRGMPAPAPARGERREFRRTAAAGRPDQAEDNRGPSRERVELGPHGHPFDRFRQTGAVGRPGLQHRGAGQLQHPGQVEVGTVRGDRRRVLGEQLGERAGRPGRSWSKRYGEADVAVLGAERGAEDTDDGAGLRVEHRAAGRSATAPQGVPPCRADRQLQCAVETVAVVRGRVGHRGRAQNAGLAPAVGGDPDVGAGRLAVPHGDGQRRHAEPLGAHEGQAERGQRGDGLGGHHPATASGSVQHEPTASWLVTRVPRWSARKPVPRGRPARSWMRTSTSPGTRSPVPAATVDRSAVPGRSWEPPALLSLSPDRFRDIIVEPPAVHLCPRVRR